MEENSHNVRKLLDSAYRAYKKLREYDSFYFHREWNEGQFVKQKLSIECRDWHLDEFERLMKVSPEELEEDYFEDVLEVVDSCIDRVAESRKMFCALVWEEGDSDWREFIEKVIVPGDILQFCTEYRKDIESIEKKFMKIYKELEKMESDEVKFCTL